MEIENFFISYVGDLTEHYNHLSVYLLLSEGHAVMVYDNTETHFTYPGSWRRDSIFRKILI